MKRLLPYVCLLVILFSCNNKTSDSPKNTVAAFIDASKEGDIAGIKKYITKSDAGIMEFGESFLAKLDSNRAKEMKEKISGQFKAKTKDAKIVIMDEKIDGDNAIVDVEFTYNGKTETRPFSLVKEDGQWKVSLISTGMKNSGAKQEDIQDVMKNINIDSLSGSINQGMEEFNKMDKDSLNKIIEEGMKDVENLKKTPKDN